MKVPGYFLGDGEQGVEGVSFSGFVISLYSFFFPLGGGFFFSFLSESYLV